MDSFKTQDGTTVKDGDEVTLTLVYDTETVEQTGVVRHFEQIERVYDDEGVATGRVREWHWELVIDDPQHPAVGFLPENVKTKS